MRILYRKYDQSYEKEIEIMGKHFSITNSRMDIKPGELVIGRYSVLPFYEEQERDINRIGAKLINTFEQHNYVADISNWYYDLIDYTPKTWFAPHLVPKTAGPFVLKGKTNSKKFLWKTHMFAETWNDMMAVYCRLLDDSLIGQQEICIREYIPLHNYLKGINDLPVSKEFRFFVCYGKLISGGFYWGNFVEDIEVPDVSQVPTNFLIKLINIISPNIDFFVIDVAQTAGGKWILIELNDGQMSGLCENEPEVLYENLKGVINEKYYGGE